ncbi:hypothetical protein [Croceicoccus pelagius]|uniref:Secreted protein n=1 Tax=Croceicoccus pelagius TaxID=1703341 RepID=A0A916YJP8_9SPHN|nr:hypothetical protein [Croceicoccus pelagius]GGD46931.1 hypothetical protein GCM10010989_21530 [Croceicoccus pelagius]
MEAVNPIVWILLAVFVIAGLIVWYLAARKRTAHLRDKFGDEYDRTVDHVGHTGKAEAALEEREKRVNALDIRPLTVEERDKFAAEWHDVKAVFVESPPEAVLHADRLLARTMKTKGFPMADFDRRHEDLTVSHADEARHYLAGHEIAERQSRGEASTEDLRQAMIHYEALFDKLVADVKDGTVTPVEDDMHDTRGPVRTDDGAVTTRVEPGR